MVPCAGVVGRMKRKENGDIPPVKNVKAKLIDGKSQNVQVSRELFKIITLSIPVKEKHFSFYWSSQLL